MNRPLPALPELLRAAETHLSGVAPEFARVITGVSPCTLAPEPDVFRMLVRAVISQLISTAAAKSIRERLEAKLAGRVTPRAMLKLSDEDYRACGISRGKLRTLRGLAEHFAKTRGLARKLAEADEDGVRELLLPLHGVGPWTVDMLLIFSIFRPDVLPVGDLGIRAGVRDLFGLAELPDAKTLTALAEPWRPYRTVATWYIWRSRSLVPKPKE
ncbi:DNA-3-methyladenine glycosylase family protein [Fimbriiglobus ruber]|uniref:DNA-3-methyladenine glycosylase II n=1 Tax=Fimbriiglobus ruber TaxID=1908690 RepID=A0A225DRV0_9BACT|nr:DNA-3-methyladenine glycosylase [Fimbriiglobus ruber]OWK42324.1 DNA-3-methyladenine glycosylase II [Fimbriiglobus ruber]